MLEKLESFAFETTLSGLTYLDIIDKAQLKGYEVLMFFVYLDSVQLAIERVAIRVSKGGHSIPKDVIQRRYHKGINNFTRYAKKANGWYLFDNSGNDYELVAKYADGFREIINFTLFNLIDKNGKT